MKVITFTLFRSDDVESMSPQIIRQEWKDVVDVCQRYRNLIADQSGYGGVTNEEFADVVDQIVPVTLVQGMELDNVCEYFAALTTEPASRKGFKFLMSFDFDSFSGFEIHMSCHAKLNQLNAYKLLVGVLNWMEDELVDGPKVQYFFEVRELVFDVPPVDASNIVAGSITAPLLRPQAEVVVAQKTESDFL